MPDLEFSFFKLHFAFRSGLDTYLGNVAQNDSRKIYPAKTARR